jgi:hypothetical protein
MVRAMSKHSEPYLFPADELRRHLGFTLTKEDLDKMSGANARAAATRASSSGRAAAWRGSPCREISTERPAATPPDRLLQFTFFLSIGACSASRSAVKVGAGRAPAMISASSSSLRSQARRNCPASLVLSCGGRP